MDDSEIEHKQIVKLRRRLEGFLRTTTPDILIKIAKSLGIKVPKRLEDKYYLKL